MAAVTAAVIGATAAIAGTTMSFVQAGEQKKLCVMQSVMLMKQCNKHVRS